MAVNWGGAGSGALSGASMGSMFGPWGTVIGAGAGGLMGLLSKDKGGQGSEGYQNWNYTPYGGIRPPRIDTKDKEILRPAQAQDFDLTMKRSLGQDVGYDPSWMTSATALTKNELGSALTDRLRNQSGMLSAQGLSGNPRAYEATKGRAERDYSSDLENSLNRLNIANMEASRADKNAATDRLAALNRFNFGQENTRALFDRGVWGAEQGLGFDAATFNRQNQILNQDEEEKSSEGMGMLGTDLLKQFGPSLSALLGGGKGINPSSLQGISTTAGQGFRKGTDNKYLVK